MVKPPYLRLAMFTAFLCSAFGVIGNGDGNVNDFFNSCRNGNLDEIRRHIVNGFPISQRDAKGNIGIVIASGRGQNEAIKLLISYGANVEDYSISGIFEGKSALR